MEVVIPNNLPDLSQAVILDKELDRHEAWLNQRNGKFTSSNLHKLLTYENKPDELPAGAKTYIEQIAVEILTGGKGREDYKNEDMERGNEMEMEAVQRFEKELNVECYGTGENQQFVELCSYFGGTPDGYFTHYEMPDIEEEMGIEVKCPKSKTHLFYLRNLKDAESLKKHCYNYYCQIQGNLYARGLKTWYFISYDERFEDARHQILILKIERNDSFINFIKKRLQLAEKYKQELLKF